MILPVDLYQAAQTRKLDRIAIDEYGIPGNTLMQRAGQAAYELLRTRWPRARRIAVLCGPGNNGGDGYVLARLAKSDGLEPLALTASNPDRLQGDAALAYRECEAAGVAMDEFIPERLEGMDIIVDALFGTGLERKITDEWSRIIIAANQSRLPILAIDLPSGLHADSGRILGVAMRAQATMTFIGLKAGMFTGEGSGLCGEIFFADLGVPQEIYQSLPPYAKRVDANQLKGLLPRRSRNAHKGDFGHVLVVGGDQGMAGAARLAGEAAYRAGAGLVTVTTHPDHASQISAGRPELLTLGVSSSQGLKRAGKRATVAAVGPGLGQNKWGRTLFPAILETKLPLVIDADGLNLLAADPTQRDNWILTPHPGEAARLLGKNSGAEVQADRFSAVREITARYGGVCVLKGAGTLIAVADQEIPIWVCDRGNPGMASGGMGDVLTGVIAGLLAQGLSLLDAARLGVWVHAVAGDAVARRDGEIGIMATDLMAELRTELNKLSTQ